MEFKMRAFKRLEFDSILNNILNEIATAGHLATYNYDDQSLNVKINNSLIEKMTQEQIDKLLNIK